MQKSEETRKTPSTNQLKEEPTWITEKCGMNTPPSFAPKRQSTDRTFSVSMEDIISNMNIPNKDKEQLYLDIMKQKGTEGTVLWKDNRIVGFRPNQPLKQISLIIKIDKNETEVKLNE